MNKIFDNYIQSISKKFTHVETSEMGYRTDFEIMLGGIFEKINVKRIDHDARAKQGNKPDFVVLKYDVPILYVEAKDIGISLDKIEKSEQMARYFGYTNLILTDYVEFRFYRNGLPYQTPIKIAEYDLKKRRLNSLPESYEHLAKTIIDFAETHKEPIRSAQHLSKIMGGKAQRIRDNVLHYLSTVSEKNASLLRLYDTIKKLLVHDLTKESFADMYAQTLVYGLFVARYHDDATENFTRQIARDLVPKSNPLLRHFFDHILGPDYDERLKFIIDELCFVFSHANVQELMKQYFKDDLWGKEHEGPDPVIHFYEDFLKEYDPELRKKLGAYYTPLPIVRFIIRSVDYILVKEFGLTDGLADTSRTNKDVHKVQILDPATGTGTFITEILKNIYSRFADQKGRWPKYVFSDLLPRLHGFELMMAPYTIAHLKVSMMLMDTGFRYFNNARLGIYLTNSLEESIMQESMLENFGFAESIATESKEASEIKSRTPIMVVVGNPPYSVGSNNKSKWIEKLIADYKKDLNERNIQPLSDDYIKFIRFGQHFIDKNGTGVLAYISNNSFIDGTIHRQMRKNLLESFDYIYIMDLHGNAKKKEVCPDGSSDQNVFDIMQGVSINMFIKTGKKKLDELGKVFHCNLQGKREYKFKTLSNNNIESVQWNNVNITAPNYIFKIQDTVALDAFKQGFSIEELFIRNATGVKTERDEFTIAFSKKEIENILSDLTNLTINEIKIKYRLEKDGRDWKLAYAKKDIIENNSVITKIQYRPFDYRFTAYTGITKGFMAYPREKIMSHLVNDNFALISTRLNRGISQGYNFISKNILDLHLLDSAADSLQTFPLFIYTVTNDQQTIGKNIERTPNLNVDIVKRFADTIGMNFTNEEIKRDNTFSPIVLLDYIYAVLHSPTYREKYKEFLKIDFPHIPYPENKKRFDELVKFGSELREIHLLESKKINKFITTYPKEGTDNVEKISYKNGNVYINSEQYFGNVPEIAWNFYIGGYQPAQKWLKDRKSRSLTNEDIEHYQKIIVALVETDRIMKEIDKV